MIALALLCAAAQEHERPNFLHILMDDWGIGDVNAYGNKATTKVTTPNIDALAQDGVLFTNGRASPSIDRSQHLRFD